LTELFRDRQRRKVANKTNKGKIQIMTFETELSSTFNHLADTYNSTYK